MQKREFTHSDDKKLLKDDVSNTLNRMEIVHIQSVDLFDHPEVYQRMMQLIEDLERKIEALTHYFGHPTPRENQSLQELRFAFKKIKMVVGDLKSHPHQTDAKQAFIEAIDSIKKSLNLL